MIAITAKSYKKIGDDLFEEQRYEEALNAYNEALKLNPDATQIVEILNNKCCALLEFGGCSAAIECLNEALNIAPKEKVTDIMLNLGAAFEQRRDLTKAIEIYQRALELSPNDAELLNNLGIAFARQDKYDEALECFDRALMIPGHHQEITQHNIQNAQNSRYYYEDWLRLMRERNTL